MVAKIGRGKSLFGALSYNMDKVKDNTASVLAGQKIIESPDGTFTISQIRSRHTLQPTEKQKSRWYISHSTLILMIQ